MKETIRAFFSYMWNNWNEQECEHAFKNSACGYKWLWKSWCEISEKTPGFGAVEEFWAYLSGPNRQLLTDRIAEVMAKN